MYYFTDDCLIGVEQIDEEHREAFRLIGEVQNLMKDESIDNKYDEICAVLKRLDKCAKEHFKHEEEYMAKINHPELERQKKQHLSFRERISEFGAMVRGRDQQEFLNELLQYLVRWLYSHVMGSDMMIGRLTTLDERKKAPFGFKDEYMIGMEIIDAEHKELFSIIDEVHEIIADDNTGVDKYDKITKLLDELMIYTESHFKDEEEYMESIRFEELEAQRVAHESFLARLEKMNPKEINEHQEKVIEELIAFMLEWLVNHILQMDKKIGQAR